MNKVTYLLGAGASANALPVVQEIPKKLEELNSSLNIYKDSLLSDSETTQIVEKRLFIGWLENIIDDFKWLEKGAIEHSSIDTFAKKLFIQQKKQDLFKLKITLSAFLSFEERTKKIDRRYDTFFASILNKDSILPNNIKILSWNYDRQLEKAYAGYTQNIHYNDHLRSKLNFITPHNYRKCFHEPHNKNDQFEIIKINGSIINLQYDNKPRSMPQEIDFEKSEFKTANPTERFCLEYLDFKSDANRRFPSLRFAWEDFGGWDEDGCEKTFIDTVSDRIINTDILVIIGYSFPFFNRQIDRKVLTSINIDKIQKVYIQDVFPDEVAIKFAATAPQLEKRIHTIQVKNRSSIDEFYLPPELTL